MRSVAAVHSYDRGLVAADLGVSGRSTERLGPIRSQPLRVLRVETMAESVADDLVGQDMGMPRRGQAQETLVAANGLVHGLHRVTLAYPSVPHKV